MKHEPQTIAYGGWVPVPCTYCGADVLATNDPKQAPYWVPHLHSWAHHRCYMTRGNGAPKEEQAALFTEDKEA